MDFPASGSSCTRTESIHTPDRIDPVSAGSTPDARPSGRLAEESRAVAWTSGVLAALSESDARRSKVHADEDALLAWDWGLLAAKRVALTGETKPLTNRPPPRGSPLRRHTLQRAQRLPEMTREVALLRVVQPALEADLEDRDPGLGAQARGRLLHAAAP